MDAQLSARTRWLALVTLCLGSLMIVLDTTIVNVALPSIRTDLGFTETSLVWVVNAYTLTFSGCLLLGGRLGDFFGRRRLFLIGIAAFTLASIACGLARSQEFLVAARALQGIGGAVVSAIALALTMNLFPEADERAKAMGIFGFVSAGGGSIGVFLGGLISGTLDWHWIFLINVPVGIVVTLLAMRLLPNDVLPAERPRIDVAGAVTVTAALMLAVYAVVNGNAAGWGSVQTLGTFAASIVLLVIFFFIETRIAGPILPLRLLLLPGLATASVMGILWSAAMFASFFLSALQLQRVLGYDPLQVGMSFLPTNVLMAAMSLGLSARIVMRYGTRWPLVLGLSCVAAGFAFFALAPVGASFVTNILPGMLLLGLGAGMAFNPILLIAMSDSGPENSGLASGIMNTAFMMGGALGLAVFASLADARTQGLLASGLSEVAALNGGYHAAFWLGAGFCILGVLIGLVYAPRNVSQDAAAMPVH